MAKKNSQAEFVKWFGPLLDALRELGDSGKPREVSNKIAETLNLSDEVLDETLKSGGNKFHNQVAWARQYLVWEGLLDSSKHGTWKLTDKGKESTLTEQEARDVFLKWVDFHRKAREEKGRSEVIEDQEGNTPEEYEKESSPELLEVLQQLSPSGFEKVCRELLREHGLRTLLLRVHLMTEELTVMEHLKLIPLSVSKSFFNVKDTKEPFQEHKLVISEML